MTNLTERINRVNARSRRVPSVIFKVILAWFLSGITLAVLVPALRAREMQLSPWLAWAVILGSLALCVGPEIRGRFRRRS